MKKKISPPYRNHWLVLLLTFITFPLIAQDTEITELSKTSSWEDSALEWGPCPDFMPAGCNIAILHGDPTKNNVDVFFKVEPNSDIPEHWHTSAERMILVAGEMEVTYEGEETQLLTKGSYAYGPAAKPHKARCGDKGPCVLFIAFEEPLDAYAVEKE
ncbi:cupin domain-containing protein [Salinimicrobium flavum]|uniref:Cupin domain-containing protein n=1 Tax=Salinimicrobium flavum TaxID=1737065 RepID=A0ABW5J0J0_9FLAO